MSEPEFQLDPSEDLDDIAHWLNQTGPYAPEAEAGADDDA